MKKRLLPILSIILVLCFTIATFSGCMTPTVSSIKSDKTESDKDSNKETDDESEIENDSEIEIESESETETKNDSDKSTESTDSTDTDTDDTNDDNVDDDNIGDDNTGDDNTGDNNNNNNDNDNDNDVVDLSKHAPTRNGSKVTFGSYPQSKVTNSTLLSKLNTKAGTPSTKASAWTSYGYYENENMWYADVEEGGEKYRGVYFSSYRATDVSKDISTDNVQQDNNGYSTNTVYWFKYDPITWTILKTDGGKALIFCDMILDAQNYSAARNNNYAESFVRSWLNDSFVKTAFNDLQKKFILVTEVDNSKALSDYSGNHPFLCVNTYDRVFLLSKAEVKMTEYGFTGDAARVKKVTEYAKSQGAYAGTNNENWWWLRTPSYDSNDTGKDYLAHNIKAAGNIYSTNVSSTSGGVIPAMWVVFDEANIQTPPANEGNAAIGKTLPHYPAETTTYNCYDETTMYIANNTNLNTFKTYCNLLKAKGYLEYSTRDNVSGNYYRTYTKGSTAVTVYFITYLKTTRIITGPISDIPSKTVDTTPETYTPTLTLLSQGAEKGSGLGLIIRLPNGKFFIYDGGYAQSDALYKQLKTLAGNDKIVIAAWIISHPHADHQEAFEYLMKNHSNDVTIENLMYNYTKATDDYGSTETIKTIISNYVKPTTNIIKPHTGQIYNFGSASIEILYTVEDYMPNTISDLNNTSMVVRFTVGTQKIIALGDVLEPAAKIICNMHGSYLKSDIVQLAHHGTTPGTKALYTNINAPILLWPSCKDNVQKRYQSSGHESLSEAINKAKDIYLAGEGTKTLSLPCSVVNNKSAFLSRMGF